MHLYWNKFFLMEMKSDASAQIVLVPLLGHSKEVIGLTYTDKNVRKLTS